MGTRSPGHVIRDIVGVTVSRGQSRFPFGLSVGSTCFAADESGRGSAQSADSRYGPRLNLARDSSKVFMTKNCLTHTRFIMHSWCIDCRGLDRQREVWFGNSLSTDGIRADGVKPLGGTTRRFLRGQKYLHNRAGWAVCRRKAAKSGNPNSDRAWIRGNNGADNLEKCGIYGRRPSPIDNGTDAAILCGFN